MSEADTEKPDPFLPPSFDKNTRYQNALKDHLGTKEAKYTVKTRKHIDLKLTEKGEFTEQVSNLKKAVPPVIIALVIFMIIVYLILPQYLVPSLLMFPLFLLSGYFLVDSRRKKKAAQKLLPPPPPPPPPLAGPVPPAAGKKQKPPKVTGKRGEKLGSETLTGVLLTLSTFICFIFYFLNRPLFLPFFGILLAFYGTYVIQVRMAAHAKQTVNVSEAEQLILAVKNQKCYKCGSTEKDVSGKIQDNNVELVCKGCGTITTWKPGKTPKNPVKES